MVDHIELGVFKNTNNPILKFFTFVTLFLLGLGPFIYKKLNRFSWVLQKILMLIASVVMGILFMLIYYIIKATLHAVLL